MKSNTNIPCPLSYESKEQLVYEVISFMQKWGLWRDTVIIANNTTWTHTYDSTEKYKDLAGVKTVTPAIAEDYTSGTIKYVDDDRDIVEWICFGNPECIFDMAYEGPLYELLVCGEYMVYKEDIIDEQVWDTIFAHTNLLNDYLLEYFGVHDIVDLQEQLLFNLDELKERVDGVWDATEFDNWEEFQRILEEAEEGIYLEPNSLKTTDELQEFAHQVIDLQSLERAWNLIVEKAKVLCREDSFVNVIYEVGQLATYVYDEFNNIFEKYGLYYEHGFSWILSCYQE